MSWYLGYGHGLLFVLGCLFLASNFNVWWC